MPPLTLPPDELRRLGYHVVDRIVEHLGQLDELPPIRAVEPDWSRDSVAPCPDEPTDPQTAIDSLFDEILPRGQRATHPRFFARIGSPSNPVSPLAAVAAHDRVGADRSRAAAYTSEHAHASVARAWRVLGFDPDHLRVLPADAAGRLAAAAVADAVRADRGDELEPFCVVATAGTTSTGAVDELEELAALCARESMWLHVDGAYGAPARLCEAGRKALGAVELA